MKITEIIIVAEQTTFARSTVTVVGRAALTFIAGITFLYLLYSYTGFPMTQERFLSHASFALFITILAHVLATAHRHEQKATR